MKSKVLCIALDALINLFLASVKLIVVLKMSPGGEPLPAHHAEVRLYARVPCQMGHQVRLLHKGLGTERAGVRLFVPVEHSMLLQRILGGKSFRTLVTLVLGPGGVRGCVLVPHVCVEVGVLRKRFSTGLAREGFFSRVSD
jgi:hypothetical protein